MDDNQTDQVEPILTIPEQIKALLARCEAEGWPLGLYYYDPDANEEWFRMVNCTGAHRWAMLVYSVGMDLERIAPHFKTPVVQEAPVINAGDQ